MKKKKTVKLGGRAKGKKNSRGSDHINKNNVCMYNEMSRKSLASSRSPTLEHTNLTSTNNYSQKISISTFTVEKNGKNRLFFISSLLSLSLSRPDCSHFACGYYFFIQSPSYRYFILCLLRFSCTLTMEVMPKTHTHTEKDRNWIRIRYKKESAEC